MSRDVLTVGSTMRIPLLYRGEYSQWVERFMNYIEEQTDGEAMINSIKNGLSFPLFLGLTPSQSVGILQPLPSTPVIDIFDHKVPHKSVGILQPLPSTPVIDIFDHKVPHKRVRTDNGTEFKNKTLAKFFDEVGITQQFSAARTPQQNGVVERRNRTLVEAARTMLTFANLPSFLWAEAIVTACFTQNCSIIHKCFDKTPYELINKRKPNIKFFCVFGCRCYLLNDYEDVGKLKAKRDIRVFVGYSKESAAFRIYKQTNS
nr:retrovirus-related Pol polyprotein from transposon TNT 1-94 [Tanacetum cinerariifolium]